MGRKELEAQLRELRKTAGAKPISKMKVTDISAEIERLKVSREETPAVRAVGGSTHSKRLESAVETVREAKESEFPVRPTKSAKAEVKNGVVGRGVAKKATPPKMSKVSKASLKKMLDELSESDEE